MHPSTVRFAGRALRPGPWLVVRDVDIPREMRPRNWVEFAWVIPKPTVALRLHACVRSTRQWMWCALSLFFTLIDGSLLRLDGRVFVPLRQVAAAAGAGVYLRTSCLDNRVLLVVRRVASW